MHEAIRDILDQEVRRTAGHDVRPRPAAGAASACDRIPSTQFASLCGLAEASLDAVTQVVEVHLPMNLAAVPYARVDALWNGSAWVIIEINTDSPSGALRHDACVGSVRQSESRVSIARTLVQMIHRSWTSEDPGRKPRVLILEAAEDFETSEPELTYFRALWEQYGTCQLQVLHGTPSSRAALRLALADCDIVQRRFVGTKRPRPAAPHALQEEAEMIAASKCLEINPQSAQPIGDKGALRSLRDRVFAGEIAPTYGRGDLTELKDAALNEVCEWVVKPRFGRSAEGVEVRRETLRAILSSLDEDRITQRRIATPSSVKWAHRGVFGVFLVAGSAIGIDVRRGDFPISMRTSATRCAVLPED